MILHPLHPVVHKPRIEHTISTRMSIPADIVIAHPLFESDRLPGVNEVLFLPASSEEGDGEGYTLEDHRKVLSTRPSQYEIAEHHCGEVCSLQSCLTEPLSHRAVDLFLAGTVMHAPGHSSSQGHFVHLGDLVQSSSDCEALPLALEAVSLASFATRFNRPEIQLEAQLRYAVSIRRLRNTDLDCSSKSSVIIACIQLLSIYEVNMAFEIQFSRLHADRPAARIGNQCKCCE